MESIKKTIYYHLTSATTQVLLRAQKLAQTALSTKVGVKVRKETGPEGESGDLILVTQPTVCLYHHHPQTAVWRSPQHPGNSP